MKVVYRIGRIWLSEELTKVKLKNCVQIKKYIIASYRGMYLTQLFLRQRMAKAVL